MRRVIIGAILTALGLALASCGQEGTADGPPQINYGRDICIECGMIIDDQRFAASYTLDDGTETIFDDLGGLIVYGRESGELVAATVWVSDFEEERMISAGSALYVPTLGVTSPMGHGILAFSDRARAESFAAELGGEVITWDVVVDLPVLDGLVGDHHDAAMNDEAMDGDMTESGEHDHEG